MSNLLGNIVSVMGGGVNKSATIDNQLKINEYNEGLERKKIEVRENQSNLLMQDMEELMNGAKASDNPDEYIAKYSSMPNFNAFENILENGAVGPKAFIAMYGTEEAYRKNPEVFDSDVMNNAFVKDGRGTVNWAQSRVSFDDKGNMNLIPFITLKDGTTAAMTVDGSRNIDNLNEGGTQLADSKLDIESDWVRANRAFREFYSTEGLEAGVSGDINKRLNLANKNTSPIGNAATFDNMLVDEPMAESDSSEDPSYSSFRKDLKDPETDTNTAVMIPVSSSFTGNSKDYPFKLKRAIEKHGAENVFIDPQEKVDVGGRRTGNHNIYLNNGDKLGEVKSTKYKGYLKGTPQGRLLRNVTSIFDTGKDSAIPQFNSAQKGFTTVRKPRNNSLVTSDLGGGDKTSTGAETEYFFEKGKYYKQTFTKEDPRGSVGQGKRQTLNQSVKPKIVTGDIQEIEKETANSVGFYNPADTAANRKEASTVLDKISAKPNAQLVNDLKAAAVAGDIDSLKALLMQGTTQNTLSDENQKTLLGLIQKRGNNLWSFTDTQKAQAAQNIFNSIPLDRREDPAILEQLSEIVQTGKLSFTDKNADLKNKEATLTQRKKEFDATQDSQGRINVDETLKTAANKAGELFNVDQYDADGNKIDSIASARIILDTLAPYADNLIKDAVRQGKETEQLALYTGVTDEVVTKLLVNAASNNGDGWWKLKWVEDQAQKIGLKNRDPATIAGAIKANIVAVDRNGLITYDPNKISAYQFVEPGTYQLTGEPISDFSLSGRPGQSSSIALSPALLDSVRRTAVLNSLKYAQTNKGR